MIEIITKTLKLLKLYFDSKQKNKPQNITINNNHINNFHFDSKQKK